MFVVAVLFKALKAPKRETPLQFGQHKDAKDVPGGPELLRSTPCGPNCNGVSRLGAFKALKSTTTNTATEEQQITKRHYSLAKSVKILKNHQKPLEICVKAEQMLLWLAFWRGTPPEC